MDYWDLGLAQECVEVGEHFGGIKLLKADELTSNFAVSVDDVGFGNHGGTVGFGDRRMLVFRGGIAIVGKDQLLVMDEFGEGGGIFVGGYA